MSAVYTQREADEAQIKQQVARIAEGIRAKDLEALRPIYATDVVSFDVEPPLQHVGVEAKLKNWANVFAVFRDADYEVRGLSVAAGDDVAFGHCFGRLHGTLMNGTATKGIWVRVTFCFRKLRRRLADRARPGFGAVRRAQRPRNGRSRTLTVLSSLSGLT
jgi:ketosteroid isomerase-like protein